jgi:hypothetical protein
MAFNLDQFRNNLKGGGARASLFEMELRWPASVTNGPLAAQLSRFMVEVAHIPESVVAAFEVPYFGRKLQYMGERTFAPVSVTIINDENFALRRALEEWMDRMSGHTSATSQFSQGIQGDGGFTTDLSVTQFGREGNRLRTYNFIGAFPTNLAAIELNWATTGEVEKYTCEFTYQWWEVEGQIPTRDNPTVSVDVGVGVNV